MSESPEAANSTIDVEQSSLSSGSVWQFFYEVVDVTNLDPAEEQQEAWEARIDGDRVGMAIIDTFPSTPFISRVAVKEEFREQGVATALLNQVHNEYGPIECRVHESNDAGEALVQSVGFEQTGESRFRRLDRYRLE